MRDDVIFEQHGRKKKLEGIATFAIFIFIGLVILFYILFFRNFLADTWISDVLIHIKGHLTSFSTLGSFYIALFGGLFFIFVPMEAYFFKALTDSSPVILYGLFIIGIFISYTIDYLIGMKLSKLSRKLVSPKKFYKMKSYLNRYGKPAIFLASAIPFVPSQQVTFVLGVFRYNRTRLVILTMGGQMLKYLAIIFFFTSVT